MFIVITSSSSSSSSSYEASIDPMTDGTPNAFVHPNV
jgi:hypothetical protein